MGAVKESPFRVPCRDFALFVNGGFAGRGDARVPLAGGRIIVVGVYNGLRAHVASEVGQCADRVGVGRVKVVAICYVSYAVVGIYRVFLDEGAGAVSPYPLAIGRAIDPASDTWQIVLYVGFLEVMTFPPLALAVFFDRASVMKCAYLLTVAIMSLDQFVPTPHVIHVRASAG